MKLFLISLPTQKTSISLLQEACKKTGVNCEILDPLAINPLDVKLKSGDALYRISVDKHYGCLELEHQLLRPAVVSFYKSNEALLVHQEENDSLIMANKGIPVPKTINYIPKNRAHLRKIVEYLGGFPIIIKALGGSHGVGVMMVDSFQSLFSISDYLINSGGRFVMKEYIPVSSSARLIVLGDNVIDSIEYHANKNDFISNEGSSPNVKLAKFSADIQQIAIDATHAFGLEFAGVDILISNDRAVVAEINFPCFFARCQMITKTDIALMMVEYLQDKSQLLFQQ